MTPFSFLSRGDGVIWASTEQPVRFGLGLLGSNGAENRSSIEGDSPGASCKAYHSCSPKEKGWGMCLSEFSHSL